MRSSNKVAKPGANNSTKPGPVTGSKIVRKGPTKSKRVPPKANPKKGSKAGSARASEAQNEEENVDGQEEDGPTRSRKRTLIVERRKKHRVLNNAFALIKNWFSFSKNSKQADEQKSETGRLHELSHPPRYKRPIERLLKRLKRERMEDIPPDINIHRHKIRRKSFIRNSGTRRAVRVVHSNLRKYGIKVQPQIGFEYNKRQRRLLLGRRHRKLEKGWKYFEPLKRLLPRRIRPNNHLPDAIFFIFSVFMFISVGFQIGISVGVRSFLYVMEDAKDYELSLQEGWDADKKEGRQFWRENAPVATVANLFLAYSGLMCISIVCGFIGVYLAKQALHLIYILGMITTMILLFELSRKTKADNNCQELLDHASTIIQLLVDHYYNKIEAYDSNGSPVMWKNSDTGVEEVVKIRTYNSANIMDRMQKTWRCCGVTGFNDYLENNLSIPPSCCNPLWNLNPYCASSGLAEKEYKLHSGDQDGNVGCLQVLNRVCKNLRATVGEKDLRFVAAQLVQLILFALSCYGLILQSRQIRQLKRTSHLRISAGTIGQSLQTAAGTDATHKHGGGGVQAVADATKLTTKQTEHIQQLRNDAALHQNDFNFDSSSSSGSSEDDAMVHTVNFSEMKNLQEFVDTEDQPEAQKLYVEKAVEGFAGRFNIVANKNLQPYVSSIFSSTYQNETNAGLEAINMILEKQFAQHTTDYDWKKLLIKPKKEHQDAIAATLAHKEQ